MKTVQMMAAFAAALGLSAASAEVVAPQDVVWVDDWTVPASLTGAPGDVDRGRVLMNKGAGNCIACHEITELLELGFHGNVGPSLDGVADRYDEAHLRGLIVRAKNTFEGTIMPSFYHVDGLQRPGDNYSAKAAPDPLTPVLTAQEVEDIVAYLVTLKE